MILFFYIKFSICALTHLRLERNYEALFNLVSNHKLLSVIGVTALSGYPYVQNVTLTCTPKLFLQYKTRIWNTQMWLIEFTAYSLRNQLHNHCSIDELSYLQMNIIFTCRDKELKTERLCCTNFLSRVRLPASLKNQCLKSRLLPEFEHWNSFFSFFMQPVFCSCGSKRVLKRKEE